MTLPASSDFENKFVCGEIMSYGDLKELGSDAAVKAAGKLRQQGKPYESPCLHIYLATDCMLIVSSSGRRGHRILEIWRIEFDNYK